MNKRLQRLLATGVTSLSLVFLSAAARAAPCGPDAPDQKTAAADVQQTADPHEQAYNELTQFKGESRSDVMAEMDPQIAGQLADKELKVLETTKMEHLQTVQDYNWYQGLRDDVAKNLSLAANPHGGSAPFTRAEINGLQKRYDAVLDTGHLLDARYRLQTLKNFEHSGQPVGDYTAGQIKGWHKEVKDHLAAIHNPANKAEAKNLNISKEADAATKAAHLSAAKLANIALQTEDLGYLHGGSLQANQQKMNLFPQDTLEKRADALSRTVAANLKAAGATYAALDDLGQNSAEDMKEAVDYAVKKVKLDIGFYGLKVQTKIP